MPIPVQNIFPGVLESAWKEELQRFHSDRTVQRLWARDPTLWPHEKAEQPIIASNLCWLDLPEQLSTYIFKSVQEVAAATRDGLDHLLLIGMGGSNLACAAVLNFLGTHAPATIQLLDTTDPDAIRDLQDQFPLQNTFFAFSSKSGKRIETHALFLFFLNKLKAAGVLSPGKQFAALTEENSYLAMMARAYGFRTLLLDPPSIVGRYSGLIHFGVALATIADLDPSTILALASEMKQTCAPERAAEENPAATLAAFLAAGHQQGLNRLVLLSSRELQFFAYRIAHLVAASTATAGKGLVPFFGRLSYPLETLQKNCLVVILRKQSPANDLASQAERLRDLNIPFMEIVMDSVADLNSEIFKWEIATALACASLKVNCFQESDGVGNLAKVADYVDTLSRHDADPCAGERIREDGICLFAEGQTRRSISSLNLRQALRTFFELRTPDSYLALCPFFVLAPHHVREIRALRDRLGEFLRIPVQFTSGPRYLYALSKIYKEGPPNGLFIIITAEAEEDVVIPGAGYTFGELNLAFALSEFESLERLQRPVLRLHLLDGPEKGLKQLADVVIQALAQIRS